MMLVDKETSDLLADEEHVQIEESIEKDIGHNKQDQQSTNLTLVTVCKIQSICISN